jgi:hypothetical protein
MREKLMRMAKGEDKTIPHPGHDALYSEEKKPQVRVRYAPVENHCPQRLKPQQFCSLYVRAEQAAEKLGTG